MRKKIISLLITSFSLCVLFAGCSGKEKSNVTISDQKSFQVIKDLAEKQAVCYEGFITPDYAVSVGTSGTSCFTEDGGTTWTRATNSSTARFCMDVVDKNTIFSGGLWKQVRFSSDGGKTWTPTGDTDILESAHSGIDFMDAQNGYICSMNKVAATNDGGATWYEIKLPEKVEKISAVHLRTKENGYVLSNDGTLFVTKDGGKSFEKKHIDLNAVNATYFDGTKGKLYYEVVPLADLLFFDENNGMLAFISRKEDLSRWIYVATTADGGDTWTVENVEVPEDFTPKRLFLTKDGKYLSAGGHDRMILLENKNK